MPFFSKSEFDKAVAAREAELQTGFDSQLAEIVKAHKEVIASKDSEIASLTEDVSGLVAKNEKSEKELASAKSRIVELEASQSDFDVKVKTEAARQAAEITASIGQLPVQSSASDVFPEGFASLVKAYASETDPRRKAAIYQRMYPQG